MKKYIKPECGMVCIEPAHLLAASVMNVNNEKGSEDHFSKKRDDDLSWGDLWIDLEN